MANATEQNVLEFASDAENGFEGGLDSDSDDYDPSTVITEEAETISSVAPQISTITPIIASTHPLPQRPTSQTPGNPLPSLGSSQQPLVTQPRTKGGFELDEDDVEVAQDEDDADSKDMLDVYGADDGAEEDSGTNSIVAEGLVDSLSPSARQANGVAPIAVSQDALRSASGVGSSVALPAGAVDTQRAATATPVPSITTVPNQAASTSDNVTNFPGPAFAKGRLAHDVVGILEDRVKEDPRGDIDAWLALIEELKGRNKQEEVRRTYDHFLEIFPRCAEQWCAYLRWEELNDYKYGMETLFKRSLMEVASVELWAMYINYVRRRNSIQIGDVNRSYKIVNDAFSLALSQVGTDKDSGKLWQDYIDFIVSGPGVVGGTSWQDNSKADALRAAYHRATAVPTSALTSMWKAYDIFENQINKANARKYLQERSPAYMTARSAYTQIQNLTKDLDRTTRPQLPPLPGYAGDLEFMQQINLWKQWIAWEEADNLVLKDEDLAAYRQRILFTYKQASMALQFWPELWYDAAEFCFSNGLESDGVKLLAQGFAANPESCLLAFKTADRIENSTSNDETADPGARQRMLAVREPFDTLLNALYELYRKHETRFKDDVKRIETEGNTESVTVNHESADGGLNDESVAHHDNAKETSAARIEAVKAQSLPNLSVLQNTISSAWIALMRAARRVQGKGQPNERQGGFRAIFAESRKRGQITSDVYIENALIEHHCYKDATGTKIFERGMKLFPEDERFALEYLKHLIAINDITNARAVFETAVSKLVMRPENVPKARYLFGFMHEYESRFGELSQIGRLEQRMSQLYAGDPGSKYFPSRFTSPTFDPNTIIPLISSHQARPKAVDQQSLEMDDIAQRANSPISRLIDSITTDSPKRSFPSDDDTDGPRKIARTDSPLKGAAGRKMNQHHQHQPSMNGIPASFSQIQPPIPPPLPTQITYLLSIMPKASTYVDTRFDAGKMVQLIRDTQLPPSIALPQRDHQPPQTHPPPNWPQNFHPPPQQLSMIPPGYGQPPGLPQAQYGSAPFRYP